MMPLVSTDRMTQFYFHRFQEILFRNLEPYFVQIIKFLDCYVGHYGEDVLLYSIICLVANDTARLMSFMSWIQKRYFIYFNQTHIVREYQTRQM